MDLTEKKKVGNPEFKWQQRISKTLGQDDVYRHTASPLFFQQPRICTVCMDTEVSR